MESNPQAPPVDNRSCDQDRDSGCQQESCDDPGEQLDVAEVGGDRLGLRTSVSQRIEQVGRSVRVWSGPEGTTVMLTVPRGEGSR